MKTRKESPSAKQSTAPTGLPKAGRILLNEPALACPSPAHRGLCALPSAPLRGSASRSIYGSVLLEVVIALALFVAAATIIGVGMNASVRSVERQRLNAHGTDLAATVLAELQLGLRTYDPADPEPFDAPFTNWTWQVIVTPEETLDPEPVFQQVEVVVRHDNPPHTLRLFELLPIDTGEEEAFREP